jgi:hypothetical protein
MRGAVLMTAWCLASCGRSDNAAVVNADAPAAQLQRETPIVRDARVDSAAHAACILGDSSLRAIAGAAVRWMPSVPVDSVWHDTTGRRACRVSASGNSTRSPLSVDSLLHFMTARGWSGATMISADGPDGTVQGVHRAGVTCIVTGRWDGGDDADSTYVPSDTIDVELACTRTVTDDTLSPPRPASRPSGTAPRAALRSGIAASR